MRLTLVALSLSCVDSLLAASTSVKTASHSHPEVARRGGWSAMAARMAAVSGCTAPAAMYRPRASTICRDGFFDSVPEPAYCMRSTALHVTVPVDRIEPN